LQASSEADLAAAKAQLADGEQHCNSTRAFWVLSFVCWGWFVVERDMGLERDRLQTAHSEALSQLTARYTQESKLAMEQLASQRTKYEAQIASLNTQHQTQTTDLQEKHLQEVEALQQQHSDLQQQHKREVEALQKQQRELQQKHTQELNSLKIEQHNVLHKLTGLHHKEITTRYTSHLSHVMRMEFSF
jgi:hypothetical protein